MRPTLRFIAARALLRLILGSLFRVELVGLERLPAGPHILACNHLSWVDPFLVLAYLPASPRIHYLGRRSAVFNRAIKRWILRFVGGVIPVESGRGELPAISAEVRRMFEQGGVLGVFPEGAIGEREGGLGTLRLGAIHFAHAGGVPIAPVGLSGTHELWLRRPVRIQVGSALQPAGDAEADLERLGQAMVANLPALDDGGGPRRWRWLTNLLR
jgi:1-acyl-sn-glycerol-3-phosphate acyltransferase